VVHSTAVWCALLTLATGFADTRAASSTGAAPQFLASRDEPLTSYRAYRRMHASSDRFNQEGWIEAWTDWQPGCLKFQIVKEEGSEYVRTKVLKAVLKREQELVADGDTERGELTSENYEFLESAPEGRGERVVLLKPKRKDVLLVDGRMVLSQDGRDLLRVEGRMSKNPSFWTSLVNVIRHYARLDGVRVPISTESVAKVKFGGVAQMDVHYEYATINGRTLSASARAAR